jgi:HEPN domain-containing protein
MKKLEFPPVHDIEVLLEVAEKGGVDLPAEAQEASSLTPYAVETRYPGSD